MKNHKLGHQQNHVSKNERVEYLWKRLIRQEADLSDETIEWMTRRIILLTDYMQDGCALIAYHKQDGLFCMRKGTLIHYESDFHHKYDIERVQHHVLFWDVDEQGWRTFQIENFLEWRPIV